MSEMAKTLTMVCAAAVAVGGAWIGRPVYQETKPSDLEGKALFADFTDPYLATSMSIAEYDAATETVKRFEVAQQQGLWVIPSHENYPADAEENLKNAATQLIDLGVISVLDGGQTNYEQYGLLAPPTEGDVEKPDTIGKQVTFKDEKGNVLADLIIGKPVPQMEGQRFVRVAKQEPVYTVKVDPTKLPTTFGDWIEKDLLKLNSLDISKMTIRDYSVEEGVDLSGNVLIDPQQRLTATVSWNAKDFKWELDELLEMRNDRIEAVEMLENEELNKKSLDDMKTALDDLKIVDVARKPEGLRDNLTTDEGFTKNREGMQSLLDKGYYPARSPNGEVAIYSSDGEIEVATKDGVLYTLRFGRVASIQQTGPDNKLNRYVMATARVDESAFEAPVLDLPPDVPAAAPSESETDKPAANDASAPPPTLNEESPATTDAPADTSAPAEGATDSQESPPCGDEEPAASDEGAPAADESTTSSTPAEGASNAADTATAAGSPAEPQPTASAESNPERDAIIKEYQRKKDEYNEKVKKAKDLASELNARFAPWYYIMSEDDYRKIHLGRADILQEKEGAGGTGVDSFRGLEDKGLKTKEEEPAPAGGPPGLPFGQ